MDGNHYFLSVSIISLRISEPTFCTGEVCVCVCVVCGCMKDDEKVLLWVNSTFAVRTTVGLVHVTDWLFVWVSTCERKLTLQPCCVLN